jgi:hypothetical protein
MFAICLILPGPGLDSCNRNEYQHSTVEEGVKRGRRVALTSPPSMTQFVGKCGIFGMYEMTLLKPDTYCPLILNIVKNRNSALTL